MTEPIDIESLDPLYRDVFRDPTNGTADDVSQAGCIALVKLGKNAWNAWRIQYPVVILTRRVNPAVATHLLTTKNFVNFQEHNFSETHSNFLGFQFLGVTYFRGAVFESTVNFQTATFTFHSDFKAVLFQGTAIFSSAQFQDVYFDRAWFQKATTFYKVKFEGTTSFYGTQFLDAVSFENCEFQSATSFDRVRFSQVPLFHGCKLHPNTSFENAIFPLPTGNEEAIRAYRALKQAFSQHQASREERIFFKLELAEEAANAIGIPRFFYKAYSLCSDYGFSITRPAVLLAVTLAAMMLVYGVLSYLHNCLPDPNACRFSTAWIEFSLLQSLPLPGLDKLSDTLRGQLFPTEGLISIGVTVAVILHKAISLLALFLMGLALRNLFKLK